MRIGHSSFPLGLPWTDLPAGGAARPAARAPTGKSRLIASRKPAAKSAGLGVRKAAAVDASLFEQAPAEEPIAPAAPAAAAAKVCGVAIIRGAGGSGVEWSAVEGQR